MISARFAPPVARRAHRSGGCTRCRSRASGTRVIIEATANAFLHHMVRNLVGLLLDVGVGKAPPQWAAEVLACRDRTRSAPTAPAAGPVFLEGALPAGLRPARGGGGPGIGYHPGPAPWVGHWNSHVVVRKDHALAHQDRAPHAFGARRPVDQVPGLRCGAVSG